MHSSGPIHVTKNNKAWYSESGVSAAPHCSAGRLLWTGNEQVVPDGGSEGNSSLFKGGKSFHQCRKTPKKRFLPPPFPSAFQLKRHNSVFWSYMFMTHTRPALAKRFLWRARNKKCGVKCCIAFNCNIFFLFFFMNLYISMHKILKSSLWLWAASPGLSISRLDFEISMNRAHIWTIPLNPRKCLVIVLMCLVMMITFSFLMNSTLRSKIQ